MDIFIITPNKGEYMLVFKSPIFLKRSRRFCIAELLIELGIEKNPFQ